MNVLPQPEMSSRAKRKIYKSSNNNTETTIFESFKNNFKKATDMFSGNQVKPSKPSEVFYAWLISKNSRMVRHLFKKCPLSLVQIQKKILKL